MTNFGNSEKGFKQILDEANNSDFYISRNKEGELKDIDMTKGRMYLMLNNPRFIGNIFKFGINDVHNESVKITDFFGESKKFDDVFGKVIDIKFPKHLKDVEIHLNVCKNFILKNPLIAYESKGIKYEEAFVIDDKLGDNHYKFILLVNDMKK